MTQQTRTWITGLAASGNGRERPIERHCYLCKEPENGTPLEEVETEDNGSGVRYYLLCGTCRRLIEGGATGSNHRILEETSHGSVV